KVSTERLWSASLSRSSSVTPATAAITWISSSMISGRRPSEKFGTHSTSLDIGFRFSSTVSVGVHDRSSERLPRLPDGHHPSPTVVIGYPRDAPARTQFEQAAHFVPLTCHRE